MTEFDVVMVEGARTAFGRMGGTIRDIPASRLAAIGIRGLVEKTGITGKSRVDGVFLGSAAHCSVALNPARWAALDAGLGWETSATYVEMQCGSAIDAINHAAWKIKAGAADVIIAGGMESYSQIPARFSMSLPPYRLMPPMPLKMTLSPVAEEQIGMGLTAENLQELYAIPREAADEFAYQSQMRASAAWEQGKFEAEIVPVVIPATRKTPEIVFDRDEHLRPETTLEGLAKLQPAFKKNGTVTAGNASGRNDGAAFVLMMRGDKARQLGYDPLARWLCGADCGVDPKIMGISPAFAVLKTLKMAGLALRDMDVMECNEAFAVQNLAVIEEIQRQSGSKIDREKWNPLGGAIAFGHPNGASGARVAMFAMRELARRGGRYGFFSSCCGGGLGVAAVIENLRR
jgi:acetyl-CoA acetyltransferase family protein